MLILSPTSSRLAPAGSFTVINRQRTGLERIFDSLSLWDWCKPDSTYDNTDLFLEAMTYAAARGCSLNMSVQPGQPFTQITVREQITLVGLPWIYGDSQSASQGCCLAFAPSLADTVNSADLRTGFVNRGTNISNILFVASVVDRVNNRDNGMLPALPSTLDTAGVVQPWGPNGITSLVDPATFFANGAVQLLPGVGMYPGVIPLETQVRCSYDNVQTLYGKIGHWNNCPEGHVYDNNSCSFNGSLIGEHFHVNGQDYQSNIGGRSGGLAAVTFGNTNSANVIGGYTGTMKRIHFFAAAFGFLQVQDDPNVTMADQFPNGFFGSLESTSFELIGEQMFHMFNPQDGVTHGGLFSLEALNLNAGYDYEGGIHELPASLTAAMGITTGKFGAELGVVTGFRALRDFGNGAASTGTFIAGGGTLSISGIDPTRQVDLTTFGFQLPVRSFAPSFDVPYAFSTAMPASFDDAANNRDYLTVGNLIPNPELGVNLTAAATTSPSFYDSNAGHWHPHVSTATGQAKTLDGWRLAGENLNIDEATLAKLPPQVPIFKFVTAADLTIYEIDIPTPARPFTDDRIVSVSFVGSQNMRVGLADIDLSMTNGYYGDIRSDVLMESPTTLKYKKASFVIEPGKHPGYFTVILEANTTYYFAAPMVNYGRPAPYNPNPGPGYSAGCLPPQGAGVVPPNLTSGAEWIDTSAGNVKKVVL